ncbi:hypothetical protein FWH09_01420 [Candidatus Saccharibacteria bacterium]|nr:hypothetical protein [Candidatus Saccharibacteria bacterium]
MAIKLGKERNNDDGVKEQDVIISNGDLQALNEIRDKYNLSSSDSVIAFAIGALKQADGKPIAIPLQSGIMQRVMPAEGLKKDGKED